MGKALSILQPVQIASESHQIPSSVGTGAKWGCYPRVKRLGRVSSSLCTVEVKSEWSYAFTPSDFFTA
jgi:hypothetical protein